MPLQFMILAIVAGLSAAVLGLTAIVDALDRYSQSRTLSAAGLMVLGLVLMGGGIVVAVNPSILYNLLYGPV